MRIFALSILLSAVSGLLTADKLGGEALEPRSHDIQYIRTRGLEESTFDLVPRMVAKSHSEPTSPRIRRASLESARSRSAPPRTPSPEPGRRLGRSSSSSSPYPWPGNSPGRARSRWTPSPQPRTGPAEMRQADAVLAQVASPVPIHVNGLHRIPSVSSTTSSNGISGGSSMANGFSVASGSDYSGLSVD